MNKHYLKETLKKGKRKWKTVKKLRKNGTYVSLVYDKKYKIFMKKSQPPIKKS